MGQVLYILLQISLTEQEEEARGRGKRTVPRLARCAW